MIEINTPLKIIDTSHNILNFVFSKTDVDPELMEEIVLRIGLNSIKDFSGEENCIYIMLMK